jgi:hypothetical protein
MSETMKILQRWNDDYNYLSTKTTAPWFNAENKCDAIERAFKIYNRLYRSLVGDWDWQGILHDLVQCLDLYIRSVGVYSR